MIIHCIYNAMVKLPYDVHVILSLCYHLCSCTMYTQGVPPPAQGGGLAQQAHFHIERLRQQYEQQQQAGQEGRAPEEPQAGAGAGAGAVGGGGGLEGLAGQPLDLQQLFAGLMANLRDIIHVPDPEYSTSESSADEGDA